MHEISEEKVSRLTEDLSDNKAIQCGDIQTKFINLSKSILASFLTCIFNRCINEDACPNCFKISQITPICKSGDQTRCTNYRPISILLQFNKVFEKNVCIGLLECIHINKNLIYYQNINVDSDPDLQLLVLLKLFIPLFQIIDNGLYACSLFID